VAVRDSWLSLVDSVLRPVRPDLERCLAEREPHLTARRLHAEARAQKLRSVEARIEDARAEVFAADDGVVPRQMVDLERRWRTLSRRDLDEGLMDLWARIAPSSWIDRKRWRDSGPGGQLDAALALAADASGVEEAEAALLSLGVALAAWGTPIGGTVRWKLGDDDFPGMTELLSEPLRAASEALSARRESSIVFERAGRLEREVQEAVTARFPSRDVLARGIAHAAFVDCVLRAASLGGRPNPVTSLCRLWRAGYALSALDSAGAVVQIPPL